MATKIAAFNLKDGFSSARRNAIQGYICDTVRPDVAVFPEAYNEFDDGMIPDIRRQFKRRGYETLTTYYNDRDERKDRHGLMLVAREELVVGQRTVRMAEGTKFARSALGVTVKDPDGAGDFDLYGVHFDDRRETTRIWQALSLLDQIDDHRPVVVAGDYNNMYRNTRAAVLRSLGYTARLLGQIEPGTPMPESIPDKIRYIRRRIGSLGCRLGGMAEGRVLELFGDAGFCDDDVLHEATMSLGSFPVAELDHVMARNMIFDSYTIKKPDLSDHHMIVAEVTPAI